MLVLAAFPVGVSAQGGAPEISTLTVSLWPEYDQPDVLVIYRAQLSPDTSLPAQLTFRLPGHIAKMHAVAFQNGDELANIDPALVSLQPDGEDMLLSFSAPSTQIQFEYYDPELLIKEADSRRFDYTFSATLPVKAVTFEVKEPYAAEEFSMSPEPERTTKGSDGLPYSTLTKTGLAAGDSVSLSAGYRRNRDTPSVQNITGETMQLPGGGDAMPGLADAALTMPAAGSAPPQMPESEEAPLFAADSGQQSNYWGYILIGAGVILLVGSGGYWWNSSRRTGAKKAARPTKTGGVAAAVTQFCHKCGASFEENSKFCHACGTARRQT
ncbi:MAG: zinc ribbon domain-containing protein [Chloroflexi bacterium]|nr:MAG: zinc ribbon domain-containing protein [Chloroflexota bacterium]